MYIGYKRVKQYYSYLCHVTLKRVYCSNQELRTLTKISTLFKIRYVWEELQSYICQKQQKLNLMPHTPQLHPYSTVSKLNFRCMPLSKNSCNCRRRCWNVFFFYCCCFILHLGHSCHTVLLELCDFMIKERFSIKAYIRLQKLNVKFNYYIYLDLWQETEEYGKLVRKEVL